MDQTYLCLLCMDELDESIRHPLCNPCLQKIIEDRGFSSQACLEKTLDYTDALESLEPVEGSASSPSNTDVREGGIRSKKMNALIDEQKNITQNLLLESEKLKSEMKVYDDYLLENLSKHEAYLSRLQELVDENEEVIKEIKNERDRLVDKQKEFEVLKGCLNDKLDVLNSATCTKIAVTLIDELDESFSGLEKWCELGQQDLPNGTIVTQSEKVLHVTNAALSVKTRGSDIKIPEYSQTKFTITEKLAKLSLRATLTAKEFTTMRESVKKALGEGQIFAVQKTVSGFRCSALSQEQDQIYLHCLKEDEPPVDAHTIELNELVGTLDNYSTVVFMDLAWRGKVRGRVTIKLLPKSPQSNLFLNLCIGDLGNSYLKAKFLSKESKGFYDFVTVGGFQNCDLGSRTSETLKLLKDILPPSYVEGAVFFHADQSEKPEPVQFSITIRQPLPFTNFRSKSFGFPRGSEQIKENTGTLFGMKPLAQDSSSSSGTEPPNQSIGSSTGTDSPKPKPGFVFGLTPVKNDNESTSGTVPSSKGFSFDFSTSAQSTNFSSANEPSKQNIGSVFGAFQGFGSPSPASTNTTTASTGIFGSASLASTNTTTASTRIFGSASLASTNTTTARTRIFSSATRASTNTTTERTGIFNSASLASTNTTTASTGIFGSASPASTNTTTASTGIFGLASLASTKTSTAGTGLFGSASVASTKTTTTSNGLFGSVSPKQSSKYQLDTDSSKQNIPFSPPSEPVEKNNELSSGDEPAKQDSKFTQGIEVSEGNAGSSCGNELDKQITDPLSGTTSTKFPLGQTNILPQKHVFGHVQEGMDLLQKAANLKNINDVVIVDCGVLLPPYKS